MAKREPGDNRSSPNTNNDAISRTGNSTSDQDPDRPHHRASD
jgi:hypothetical protein